MLTTIAILLIAIIYGWEFKRELKPVVVVSLLSLSLIQPIFKATIRHSLPRRRLFQRKARQTYRQRMTRRIERMWAEASQSFDLNHAA